MLSADHRPRKMWMEKPPNLAGRSLGAEVRSSWGGGPGEVVARVAGSGEGREEGLAEQVQACLPVSWQEWSNRQ